MNEHREGHSERRISRQSAPAGGLATFLAVGAHVLFLTHAGALWRDEAGAVQLAGAPHWGEVWERLPYDSFPALFPPLLHGWSALGFGGDSGLRCLGLLIGLATLAVLWWNARIFGLAVPYASLAMLATNATLLGWGDSLRPYGAGCLLVLLTVGRVWAMVRHLTATRVMLACGAGVLSVQCLYQNVFPLAAICLGASFVCLRRGRFRPAMAALAVGLSSALSLWPYAGVLRESAHWRVVQKMGFNGRAAWATLSHALRSPD